MTFGAVLVLLIFVQIHGASIACLITLQWKCEKLLGEKQPKFTETSTPLRNEVFTEVDKRGRGRIPEKKNSAKNVVANAVE